GSDQEERRAASGGGCPLARLRSHLLDLTPLRVSRDFRLLFLPAPVASARLRDALGRDLHVQPARGLDVARSAAGSGAAPLIECAGSGFHRTASPRDS